MQRGTTPCPVCTSELKTIPNMKKIVILILIPMLLTNSCKEGEEYPPPLIIGHRGAMGHATENTIPSIRKAIELEVDMIEIDVFMLDDREFVLFHDKYLERLTNGKGKIIRCTLPELRQLLVEGRHGIPTLREAIEYIDKRVPLNIELKNDGGAEKLDTIMKYYVNERGWTWNDFVVSSFDWEELIELRKYNKKVKMAIVIDEEEDPAIGIPINKSIGLASINANYKTLTKKKVDSIHKEGNKVYAWTVNEPEDIEKMKALQVDGIITDYPERVKAILQK